MLILVRYFTYCHNKQPLLVECNRPERPIVDLTQDGMDKCVPRIEDRGKPGANIGEVKASVIASNGDTILFNFDGTPQCPYTLKYQHGFARKFATWFCLRFS